MLVTPVATPYYLGMIARISRPLLAEILAHAAAAPEREVCGLLFGGDGYIAAAVSARNVHPDPACFFELDPAALLAAHKVERAGGLRIVGHYHSHPTGAAEPSPADAAAAAGEGEYWLVVSPAGAATLWRAVPGGALHGMFDSVDLVAGDESCLASVESARH